MDAGAGSRTPPGTEPAGVAPDARPHRVVHEVAHELVRPRIEVADRGDWRGAPADPGHRGRGLLLLSRLADGHEVHHGEDGTRVRLWWQRPP
jgi:hypothetical protein